ncbi:MAG: hypothetical protein ACRYHQ_32565, partial [Janthinobacterium lividum]
EWTPPVLPPKHCVTGGAPPRPSTESDMIRKSTPKYEVVHVSSGTIVEIGVSKTSAEQTRRMMGKKVDFTVRPVRRAL